MSNENYKLILVLIPNDLTDGMKNCMMMVNMQQTTLESTDDYEHDDDDKKGNNTH